MEKPSTCQPGARQLLDLGVHLSPGRPQQPAAGDQSVDGGNVALSAPSSVTLASR